MQDIRFSILKKTGDKPMTKRLRLVDGNIEADNKFCGMDRGTLAVHSIKNLEELVPILASIPQSQAIAVGVPKLNGVDSFDVVLKDQVAQHPGAIARSKDHLVFPTRTLIPFDHDPHERCPVLIDSPVDFIEHMSSVDPQFSELGYVRTYSTSSGIYLGDEEIRPAQGFHLYGEGDGNKLAAARDTLFMKAFEVDLGYIKYARNGRMLPRTIFDPSVMRPWSLMFEAGAVLEDGLEQRRPEPEFREGTALAMGRLRVSGRLREKYQKVVSALRGEAWPESKRVQDKYLEVESTKLVDAHGGEIEIDRARRVVMSRAKKYKLLASDLLYFDHMDKPVPVRDVMSNIDQYKGKTLRDPVEPEAGANKAWVIPDGSGIWSHLHGGQRYKMTEDEAVKPEVRLVGLTESQCQQLNQAIADPEAGLYQRGEVCVRTGKAKEEEDPGVERDPKSTRLYVCDVHRFTMSVVRSVEFIRVNMAGDEWVVDCPDKVARKYLGMAGEWAMPQLRMVTDTPFMREDGVIVCEDGYDQETGVLMRDVLKIGDVIANAATIKAAREVVLAPFDQFPWIDEHNKAVILSLQLSLIQRPVIDCTPLHGITAPIDAAGTGKGLAIGAAVGGVLGTRPSALNMSTNRKDENEKVIESILLAGDRAPLLDNIEEPLQGGKLCSALTEPLVNVRPFHTQDRVDCTNTSTWIANGNGLRANGDLARRSIFGVMDAEMEFPHQRTTDAKGRRFEHEGNALREYCISRRALTVMSWLVLLSAYRKVGSVIGHNLLGASFSQWDTWVRGPLVFFNMGDPSLTQVRVQDDNEDRSQRRAGFEALYACFGEELFQVKDIKEHGDRYEYGTLHRATNHGENFAELWGKGATNSRVLGTWLSENQTRIGGLQLVRCGERGGSALWGIKVSPERRCAAVDGLQKVAESGPD